MICFVADNDNPDGTPVVNGEEDVTNGPTVDQDTATATPSKKKKKKKKAAQAVDDKDEPIVNKTGN